MKTIIEIHALQNFAPSNLNRDDTGAPKDALFGGSRRARVSSQCHKRAVREYFKEQNKDWVADRTKRIVDALKKRIQPRIQDQKDFTEENLVKAIEVAVSSLGSNKKVKVDKEKKTDVLLFLSPREVDALEKVITESYTDLLKAKLSDEVVQSVNDSLDGENKSRLSLDVALFGRMLAVMPEKNQNAACQVAHSISTHSVEREFDFYTAVDDLKPEDTTGADMMGTVEFNSACFYRYAAVDWDKLVTNLQGNTEFATKGLRAFLEGFIVAEPTGKQNTFAAHNPPEFVAVSVRRNTAPRNLANAFETAIRVKKDESLTRRSAEELAKKAKVLQSAFGGEGKTWVLNLTDAKLDGFGNSAASLQELLDGVLANIQE
ncbi:MAG: CRISPR-associated protein, Cse4 family [Candidatus Gallionella acididurans]|uniref:CRISPR-associated protein, Cse4 family n=1 Tax=Candidatus Gallionella acididurans TaxID=1796491 RepID=A0A139BQB3_9PROT|nr:MAG: CRISPR-associated protein, Cse4 family [Candidatus Gallionella acididurans]